MFTRSPAQKCTDGTSAHRLLVYLPYDRCLARFGPAVVEVGAAIGDDGEHVVLNEF